jgi:hypothetical protein
MSSDENSELLNYLALKNLQAGKKPHELFRLGEFVVVEVAVS